MKVICAGLSKTGTKSMAKALRSLGYTVFDLMEHVNYHIDEWLDIYRLGKIPDFVSMYQRVDAVTDLPAAFWYEEIFEAFPDAKVVLTVRDNDETWLKSWVKHCQMRDEIQLAILQLWPGNWNLFSFAKAINTATYGTLRSESTVLFKKKYREHNQRVQAVIPKEKLLIFNVKQGWKPLCEFLGCDVPEQEFPRENVESSFIRKRISELMSNLKFKIFVSLAAFVVLLSVLYLKHSIR